MFKNELQTRDIPYGWTMIFENSTNNSSVLEEKMKGYACFLIALINKPKQAVLPIWELLTNEHSLSFYNIN